MLLIWFLRVILATFLIFLFLFILLLVIYVFIYHSKAYPEAQAIADAAEREGKDYLFAGKKKVGFIIFTGAKVDEEGYAYLANLLNQKNYTVLIPNQLFNLSIFGIRHGIKIMKNHTEIDRWILIGHSLGGMPVTRIAKRAPEHLAGIVYLGSYAKKDISCLPFPALRLTAEHDGILNNDRMDSFAHNLPKGSQTIMLKETIHKNFGGFDSKINPEERKTGSVCLIPWQEQNEKSAKLILDFFAEEINEP